MPDLKPLNFKRWIDEHRHLLKPPVGNAQIWEGDRDFMVTVVGGPNSRSDYHVDEGEEFFYQIEGDITLRVLEHGKPREIPIREGETFLWVCDRCGHELYRESFHLTDIVQQLPPIFARYWGDPKHTTCKQCGHVHEKR